MAAVNQVCAERGIEPEVLFETLKRAMIAAYRKDYGDAEEVEVQIDKESGAVTLFRDGKDITPPGFGRIAAQTAKQVILQGVREAEKDAIFNDFKNKVGSVIPGMLQRREGGDWLVDLGRTIAVLPRSEQVYTERYRQNQRLRFYIKEIEQKTNKTRIILSRKTADLVKGLLEQEVPEISSGAIAIKGIAREPGHRTKVAVAAIQEGVDPVGSCVGQRGVRIQAITDELGGERIDVILWHDDPRKFVAAALSPALVSQINVDQEKREAKVVVPEEQISLAIGREGQNLRLAARLTNFHIEIYREGEKELIGSGDPNGEKTEEVADNGQG